MLPLFGKAHPNMTASAHVDAPLAAIDSSLINRTCVTCHCSLPGPFPREGGLYAPYPAHQHTPPPTPTSPSHFLLFFCSIVGVAGGNVLRGLIWGNVAAVSQALGTSFAEQYAAATAAKQAISLPALRAGFGARITTFWPIIVG